MFTKPEHGWTEIHLEDFEGLGSYIQDVPVMVLDAAIYALQAEAPLELWFDEEGSSFTLIADAETKIVAKEEGEMGTEEYHILYSKLDIIREIKNDIEKYFSKWVMFTEEFDFFDDADEEQTLYIRREKLLKEKLAMLETELQGYTV